MTLEALGGTRYVYSETELDVPGFAGVTQDRSYLDPFFGIRGRFDWTEDLFLQVRGDVGGFDIASDLTWQLIGLVGYSPWDSTTVLAGYRLLDIDYDDGSGANRFELDVQIRGPFLGVAFGF